MPFEKQELEKEEVSNNVWNFNQIIEEAFTKRAGVVNIMEARGCIVP